MSNELLRLRDLTLTYELQPNDLLHVYQNGADYAIRYNNFRNEVISDIPNQQPIWNARFLDSHEIDISLPKHNDVLIWDDINKNFTHKYLEHSLIDFNTLNSSNGQGNYLTVRNGALVNQIPSITEIRPYQGAVAGHFLVVADTGDRYVEVEFDTEAYLEAPSTPISNTLLGGNGVHYVNSTSNNRPPSSTEGFVITSKTESSRAVSLIYTDTNNGNIFINNHRGISPNPNAFEGWQQLYSHNSYPINNGISDNRTNALVTANITNTINNRIDTEIASLSNALNARINITDSNLLTHRSSGDHDNRYMRSDVPPTMNVGRGLVYFENNSRDGLNGTGVTIRTSQNPQNGLPEQTGSLFAVRSSNHDLKFWVGMNHVSFGTSTLLARNVEMESLKIQRNQTNYTNTLAIHGHRTNNNEYANIHLINDAGNNVRLSARKVNNTDELRISGANVYHFDANISAPNIKTMANRDIYISTNRPTNNIGNNGDVWYVWS